MRIHIQVPPSYPQERDYILTLMFYEFLGIEISIERTLRQDTLITFADKGQLIIPDVFFACSEKQWLTAYSLPSLPLPHWDIRELGEDIPLVNPQIPIIFGVRMGNDKWYHEDRGVIFLGLDVFGSAFFMLTRYEEIVKPERDIHDRFPSTSSLAWKGRFLDRPIINEYLEILWLCLKRLWPNMNRKKQEFGVIVSHDVDFPFLHAFTSPFQMSINCVGDILLRKDLRGALERSSKWIKVRMGKLELDPYNTFDLIMDISERHQLKSTFYFMNSPRSKLDCNYSINHPLIRKLVHHIYERGHSIGLHASYHSYLDSIQTKMEFERLQKVCREEGGRQEEWGVRQHYLRWQTPITFENLNDAGLDYDATLAFADHTGFRCGICYEYPVFNAVKKEGLRLRERPLIIMDVTVLDDKYMGLGKEESAFLKIMEYKNICRRFNGKFTLLWHNNRFTDPRDLTLYKNILDG